MNDTKTFSRRRPKSVARVRVSSVLAGSALLLALGAAIAPGIVLAEEGAEADPSAPRKVRIIGGDGTEASVPTTPRSDIERYCTNIADPAKDARAAVQTKRLQDLEAEVNAKIDALEAKRREYQDWLQQREAFIDSTSTIMIDIYAGMRPDAAASQLAGLDRATAASIVAKLKSRTASAILAEMPTTVAAEIANLIVQKTNKTMDVASAAPERG